MHTGEAHPRMEAFGTEQFLLEELVLKRGFVGGGTLLVTVAAVCHC